MKGYFKCLKFKKFISLKNVCNNIINCFDGSDELFCHVGEFENKNCQIKNFTEIFCLFDKQENKSLDIPKNFYRLTIIGDFQLINSNIYNLFLFIYVENSKKFIKLINMLNLSNIVYLTIINSNLKSSELINLQNLYLLQYIDLSKNSIKTLNFLANFHSKYLLTLNISFNEITSLEFYTLLENLEILEVKGLILPINIIKDLKNLKYINGDSFYLCCMLWNINGKDKKCNPSYTRFHSCSKIIKSFSLSILIWIFGCIGFLLNIILFLFNLFPLKKLKFYFLLLFFGDILMSIYLLILSTFNLYLNENNITEKAGWQNSFICQFMGTIMTCSIILTIGSMLMITLERYQVIKNPFNKKHLKNKSNIISLFLLSISILMSSLPFLYESVSIFINFFFIF